MGALAPDQIKWEDPPAAAGRGAPEVWPTILAALTENPGSWALVALGKTDSGTSIRTHAKKFSGTFQVTSRRHGDNGTRATYARWMPEAP